MYLLLCKDCLGVVTPREGASDCPCRSSGVRVVGDRIQVWGRSVVVDAEEVAVREMSLWTQPLGTRPRPELLVSFSLVPRSEYQRVPYPIPF